MQSGRRQNNSNSSKTGYNQISTQSSHGGVRFTIEDEDDEEHVYSDEEENDSDEYDDGSDDEDIETMEDEVVYGQGGHGGNHRPGYHLSALHGSKGDQLHQSGGDGAIMDADVDDGEMEEISFDTGHRMMKGKQGEDGDIELGSMKKTKKIRGKKRGKKTNNKRSAKNNNNDDDTDGLHDTTDDNKSLKIAKRNRVPDYSNPLNVWTIISFSWMQDLLELGHKKPLELSDLYYLADKDSAESIYKTFKHYWIQEMNDFFQKHEKITKTDHPSLIKTLFKTFGQPFAMAAILKLIHDSALFMGPVLLSKLVNFLDDPSQPLSTGLKYVLYLFLINVLMSLCLRQYFW